MRDALYFAVWTDEVEKKATVGTRMVPGTIDTCNFDQKPCSKACSPFPPFEITSKFTSRQGPGLQQSIV
jgi:hypothetical protein